ncbi:mitofusin, partial [Coemansia spiralis]
MSLTPTHDVQQRVFADKCRRLHSYLLGTRALLREVGECNRTKWPVHYPLAQGPQLRRTGSMHSLDLPLSDALVPSGLRRTVTAATADDSSLPSNSNSSEGRLLEPGDLSVLRLDLRLSSRPDSDVMGSLEESSIARLFDERLAQCEGHVDKLIARVADKASKILVTGDLNAGKSTLVNALIRHDILPFDQQPCTMLFCEVLDASLNNGIEEIHAVPHIDTYDRRDPATFAVVHMADLEDVVAENSE